MISFEDATKTYPDGTVAVDALDLVCETGRVTVLVGPSGCGKTTSLRMVNRMVDPSDGRVLIDDTDVRSVDPPTLRRGIGYVIQHAGLFPHRRVAGNIATVPQLVGWPKPKARERALELMELVGLDQAMADRYPYQLSGGQQQRVGVARALAADPPILLMDEPFSAVDPVVRGQLQEELLRLQSELHKTIVFVTHDIDEAIKLGDRIAVFQVGGRLAQVGPPPELLAAPANEFVTEFLGYDRGFRRLSFLPADLVRLRDAPSDLLLDDDERPVGWQSGEPVQSFSVEDNSLRAAFDATLRSPSGTAVALDEKGRAVGVASYADMFAVLTAEAEAGGEPVGG